jgi:hypothetical protein
MAWAEVRATGIYNQVEALSPSNAQENSVAKKGSRTRDKDADFAVLDKIRKSEASLDDLLPQVDWSADNDKFNHRRLP